MNPSQLFSLSRDNQLNCIRKCTLSAFYIIQSSCYKDYTYLWIYWYRNLWTPNLHPAATAFEETDCFQYQKDEQFDKTIDTSMALYFYNNNAKNTHNVYFSLNGDSEPSTHIESTALITSCAWLNLNICTNIP